MSYRWHLVLIALVLVILPLGLSAEEVKSWVDPFYQYRLSLDLHSDREGLCTVPVREDDLVSLINLHEDLKYNPIWFAYNHLKVVEVDGAGRAVRDVDAGFTLVEDEQELLDPDTLRRGRDRFDVRVEPGSMYLLRYTAAGAGASPVLEFEPVFPVIHPLRRTAYLISHEPRMLPLAETTREVLIVPNMATMPLHVKGRFVKGLKSISLRRARIVFMARFQEPGEKRLMLYYQPQTGHFLTVPQRRQERVPAAMAKLVRLGPAEKREGRTRYRLPGNDAVDVWFAETTVKLTPASRSPQASEPAVRISSAANEAQSFQLVLAPRRGIGLAGVSAGDLVCGSSRIPADRISFQRMEYVQITKPSEITPVLYIGPIADPLTAARAERLTPVAGNVGYWVTVRTPPGMPAGTYRGQIKLELEGQQPLEIPLELEVYGFELPEFSPFRSSMGGAHLTKSIGSAKTIADYHAVTSRTDVRRLARAYFDVMARNKFTPQNVMQFTPIGMKWTPPPQGFNVDAPDNLVRLHDWDFAELNEDLRHYVDELKVNAFLLVHTNPSVMTMFKHLPGEVLEKYNRQPPHSSLDWQNWQKMTHVGYAKRPQDDYVEITRRQFDDVVLQFYRAMARNLEEHGWLDHAYILVDETAERGYGPFLDYMRLLKSDPLTARIKFVWCIQSPDAFNHKSSSSDPKCAFNGLLDVYVPETNENHHFWEKHYFSDYGIPFEREKLWNYVTYTTRVAIDTPGVNNRAIALEVFNNGGAGFLIWGTFIWDSKEHQESNHDNPWEQPWTRWGNGAMAYFYPPRKDGPARAADFTVVPSLRVEMYREGVDDFEYAWMLEKLVAKARAEGRDVAPQQAVLDDIKRFFAGPVHWSQNDAWYLELRDRLARANAQLLAK